MVREWRKAEHLGGQIIAGRQIRNATACSIRTVCVRKELNYYTHHLFTCLFHIKIHIHVNKYRYQALLFNGCIISNLY